MIVAQTVCSPPLCQPAAVFHHEGNPRNYNYHTIENKDWVGALQSKCGRDLLGRLCPVIFPRLPFHVMELVLLCQVKEYSTLDHLACIGVDRKLGILGSDSFLISIFQFLKPFKGDLKLNLEIIFFSLIHEADKEKSFQIRTNHKISAQVGGLTTKTPPKHYFLTPPTIPVYDHHPSRAKPPPKRGGGEAGSGAKN